MHAADSGACSNRVGAVVRDRQAGQWNNRTSSPRLMPSASCASSILRSKLSTEPTWKWYLYMLCSCPGAARPLVSAPGGSAAIV